VADLVGLLRVSASGCTTLNANANANADGDTTSAAPARIRDTTPTAPARIRDTIFAVRGDFATASNFRWAPL
jgi:hypothetical protein